MKAGYKLLSVDKVDEIISAEIPDKLQDPELHAIVTDHMMHGPCGAQNLNCSCMIDGKCSKKFPKRFHAETSVDTDGYPVYRRRDSGLFVEKSGVCLDNRNVVPYNKTLLKRYQAHINVEWCNQAGSIKYLFKYINKGPDRVTVTVEGDTQATQVQPKDEVKEYLDCRYLSACEAAWRIFQFDVHHRYPSVMRLPFHLEGQQQVIYGDEEDIDYVVSKEGTISCSKFLSWMEYNKENEDGRHLTYVEFPTEFVFKKVERRWSPRKQGVTIGRIYTVSPSVGEAYYMRILLNKVKGPTSFEDIRTVDGVLYPTFRHACYARGLLEDDKEYIEAIKEASETGSGYSLRTLFATLLLSNSMSRPELVWESTWQYLSEDIVYKQKKKFNSIGTQCSSRLPNNLLLF